MDAAIWQDDHWTDPSALLDCGPQTTAGAANVVLVSFDRKCIFLPSVIEHMLMMFLAVRLKVRARQFGAANEKDMAATSRSRRRRARRAQVRAQAAGRGLRMGKRTSGLGVRLIGMGALVLVRELVRPVCIWTVRGQKNLKGRGESFS